MIALLRRLAHLESLVYNDITRDLGVKARFRPWLCLGEMHLLYHWANEELKQSYLAGLAASGAKAPSGSASAQPATA